MAETALVINWQEKYRRQAEALRELRELYHNALDENDRIRIAYNHNEYQTLKRVNASLTDKVGELERDLKYFKSIYDKALAIAADSLKWDTGIRGFLHDYIESKVEY